MSSTMMKRTMRMMGLTSGSSKTKRMMRRAPAMTIITAAMTSMMGVGVMSMMSMPPTAARSGRNMAGLGRNIAARNVRKLYDLSFC